jgi:uncharacterized protein YprB with RNaseH-like and TPR domain
MSSHANATTCSTDCGYKARDAKYYERTGGSPPPRLTLEDYSPPAASTPLPEGRPFDDERNKKRITNKKVGQAPIRIGVFDIETTGLNASFGRVLCAVIKTYDPVHTEIFRADSYDGWNAGRRASDFELVGAILAYIEDIDVLIGHNAVNFDAPFLRTRGLIHGMPHVQPLKIYDPCLQARKQFRFHRNSLAAISEVLETAEKKTPLLPGIWQRAIGDGDKGCLDQIVDHCIADVDTLEEVAWKMRHYIKQIDALGSWR